MVWNVGFVVFVSFAPLMLIAGGRTIAEAGFLVSLVFWVSLGSVPLGGFLIDRTGRANLLISGAILGSAAIIFLLPFGQWVVTLVVLMGLIRGPCAGGVNALPGEVLTPENRSAGFGVYFTVYYIGVALLSPVAGYLPDVSGTAVAPVLFAGFCTASTAVALLAFRLLQRRWAVVDDPTAETATDS
jgi:MFS family permease